MNSSDKKDWFQGNGKHSANHYFHAESGLVMQVNWAEGADKEYWKRLISEAPQTQAEITRLRELNRDLVEAVKKARSAAIQIQATRWGSDGDCGVQVKAEQLEDGMENALAKAGKEGHQ